MFLKEELKRYEEKRPKCKDYWKTSTRVMPGGISHNIRTFGLNSIGSYPVIIESANGPYIKDIDGNQYIDFWNGHFAMILGHKHPQVNEAVKTQLDNGWHFGTLTEHKINLAETLIKDNPSIEKLRFAASGTEATMSAVRLARAITGRRMVAKAKTGWHGANDLLLYDIRGIFKDSDAPGVLNREIAGVSTFTINSEEIFNLDFQKYACVIIEPILGGAGGFPVDIDYLKRLREITLQAGTLLIFDEVITGYRMNYGLFQNKINVLPDLTAMGKIVGGGFPLGVIGGREELIDRANPERKHSERVLIGGGTYSGFPPSMVAGLKTLEILKNSEKKYLWINKEGDHLRNQLNRIFTSEKLPIVATGKGSLVMLHVLTESVEDPSITQIQSLTDSRKESILQLALFNRGILGLHGLGALSMSHKKEHLNKVEQALEEIGSKVCQ